MIDGVVYWGFPFWEANLKGEKGFEEWWEGDNGLWYTVMDEGGGMYATTYCIPYWGA